MNKMNVSRMVFLFLLLFLFVTRFYNLSWGQPYPFHPDEGQIMAPAVDRLTCDISKIIAFNTDALFECMNPHFFAYGQFPLYIAFILKQLFIDNSVIALRFISATASVLNAVVMIKILQLVFSSHEKSLKEKITKKVVTIFSIVAALIIILSPYAIQASHFGTTESLLMLLYTLLTYISVYFYKKNKVFSYIFWSALIVGLSISTKISAVSFSALPLLVLAYSSLSSQTKIKYSIRNKKAWAAILKAMVLLIRNVLLFIAITLFTTAVTAPHNLISYHEAYNQIMYEVSIGRGSYIPFYTYQFKETIPFIFQAIKIFPYTHGALALLAALGILFLPWSAPLNILRLALALYFVPSGMLFAKWTRFLSPIFPLITIFGIISLFKMYKLANNSKQKKLIFGFITAAVTAASILQGIAYIPTFTNPDIRFQASSWMVKNIPPQSYILTEARNIVDGPAFAPGLVESIPPYRMVSFNFYELEEDPALKDELTRHLSQAEYIFVPSRRVFANYTCWRPDGTYRDSTFENLLDGRFPGYCEMLKKEQPLLYEYYKKLFDQNGEYELVQEFRTPLLFPDEWAEETWSVFDHPVIRIYKKKV